MLLKISKPLTPNEKVIIRHICELQAQSYERLASGTSEANVGIREELLKHLDAEEIRQLKIEYVKHCKMYRIKFKNAIDNPETFTQILDNHNIQGVYDILMHIQGNYALKAPKSLGRVWDRITQIEDFIENQVDAEAHN